MPSTVQTMRSGNDTLLHLGGHHVTQGDLPEAFAKNIVKELSRAAKPIPASVQEYWAQRLPSTFEVRIDPLAPYWRENTEQRLEEALRSEQDVDHTGYTGKEFMAGFTPEELRTIDQLRTLPQASLYYSDGKWGLDTDQIHVWEFALSELSEVRRVCEKLHTHPMAKTCMLAPTPCPEVDI